MRPSNGFAVRWVRLTNLRFAFASRAKALPYRAKIASLQFPRPEIRRILAETGGGARRPRAVRETGRSKPNEQRSFASGSAARRLLRIEDVAVAGGARSARPVGEAARSKPNEQGSTASRQAQQDDHCELWGACSPVHRRVKKTFLTR